MDTIINSLKEIVAALETLELKGYSQCKTYSNIYEELIVDINLIIKLKDKLEEEKTVYFDDKEETSNNVKLKNSDGIKMSKEEKDDK